MYTVLVFGSKSAIFVIIHLITMSKEVLEISILVDEKFDVSFNLVEGFFGFVLKFFAK